MNKLQHILDTVRKANPETMELTEGSKVKCRFAKMHESSSIQVGWFNKTCTIIKRATEYSVEKYIVVVNRGKAHHQTIIDVGTDDITKIIGHTLYPSHLLVALGKIDDRKKFLMDSDGQFCLYEIATHAVNDLFSKLDIKLNPTQPLEPQLQANPELVETLYKLLT